jgi:hypothetical protein
MARDPPALLRSFGELAQRRSDAFAKEGCGPPGDRGAPPPMSALMTGFEFRLMPVRQALFQLSQVEMTA